MASPRSYGMSSSISVAFSPSTAAIAARMSPMPSPLSAEPATAPGYTFCSRSTVAGSAISILLMTTSSGMSPPPISPRTLRTAAIWRSGSSSEASTTWSNRSDSVTSSRVERKASTSS